MNDLATTHPHLAAEVSPNSPVKATEVHAKSAKQMLWRCKKGHEWITTPAHRLTKNGDCEFCSGQKVLLGVNDLATTHPDLVADVSPRSPLKATDVTSVSGEPVLWECKRCGHSWICSPLIYLSHQNGKCPRCSKVKRQVGVDLRQAGVDLRSGMPVENTAPTAKKPKGSVGELQLFEFVRAACPPGVKIVRNDRAVIAPYELDVYIPKLRLAFEYNGTACHSNAAIRRRCKNFNSAAEYHYNKVKMCADQGVCLFHVWEKDWRNNPEAVKRFLLAMIERAIHRRLVISANNCG